MQTVIYVHLGRYKSVTFRLQNFTLYTGQQQATGGDDGDRCDAASLEEWKESCKLGFQSPKRRGCRGDWAAKGSGRLDRKKKNYFKEPRKSRPTAGGPV